LRQSSKNREPWGEEDLVVSALGVPSADPRSLAQPENPTAVLEDLTAAYRHLSSKQYLQ